MTIINCIKQVRDLDIVLKTDWVIEADGLSVNINYANRIMNTYDETSLEIMLRLQDIDDQLHTTVVTIGDDCADSILRKAMAVGVKEAVRIEPLIDLEFYPEKVALLLKQYVMDTLEHNKSVDMIMCGRQADNGNHGQTGQLLAEMLGWPCITMVTNIIKSDNTYKISRLTASGIEHLYVKTPVVVTITQSDDKFLRMATLKNTMSAKKKTIQVFDNMTQLNHDSKFRKQVYYLKNLSVNQPKKQCVFLKTTAESTQLDQLKTLIAQELKRGMI